MIITNVPQPYRIPLFNEINRKLNEKGAELLVVFGASGYSRRKSMISLSEMKFRYEMLKSLKISFGNSEKTMFTYSGIPRQVASFRPDRIIVIGWSMATVKIYFMSFFRKLRYIIWSGSMQYPGRFDSAFRKMQRRMLARRASAFIAYGSSAKDYLISMGAPPDKIVIGINTVDTNFFATETDRMRELKHDDSKKHLIYFGYLVPRKKVGTLIEMVSQLAAQRRDFVLDVLGDGSERSHLEEMVSSMHLGDVVKFHGFIQKEKLPEYLAKSTCFLFQTGFDIWGLVLNEAMAAGIPVLASVNAGATRDLIENGVNGFAVDYNHTSDVLKKLNMLLDNPDMVSEMGKQARETVQSKASIEKSAAGFMHAINL